MAKTGHNFYMLSGPRLKTWDHHTRELPAGHYIHPESYETLSSNIAYDIVLCQNKLDNYSLLRNVADRLSLPLIVLDHTEPPVGLPSKVLNDLKTLRADAFVTITPHNRRSWGLDGVAEVIPHGIDLDVFTGYTGLRPEVVNVSNHFVDRDPWLGYRIFRNLIKQSGVPAYVIGENPAHANEFADTNIKFLGSIKDPAKLAENLASYRLYLNTTQLSPLPMSLLEAMAVGLPVVTSAQQQIPEVVRDSVEGFISNEPEVLANGILQLINAPDLAREMGQNARARIAEKFSMGAFIKNWNEIFHRTYYGV